MSVAMCSTYNSIILQPNMEAELERTIQSMNGVESVRVHLVLPRDSLFLERERPAKASVVLKLRGTRLTEQVAMPVANLVASSWDGLTPQNVRRAIEHVQPYAVDVSSGVESSPGQKDAGLIAAFIENAMEAEV